MPFNTPITTAAGEQITSLLVRKGTIITSPIPYLNRAEEFWGPNSRKFEPERWLDMDSFGRAKEIQGHRHILTFSDGPRICLGRSFALTEFKVNFPRIPSIFRRGATNPSLPFPPSPVPSGCFVCVDPQLRFRVARWHEDRYPSIHFTETKGCRRGRGSGAHESETHRMSQRFSSRLRQRGLIRI